MSGIVYVDDMSGANDFAKITNAINSLYGENVCGGTVYLGNKTYTVSQSILLHRNLVFKGVGPSSVIFGTADEPILKIVRNDAAGGDSEDITISDMALDYSTNMSTSSHFHIEADRPVNLKILNVKITGRGRDKSGILTWDARTGNQGLPIVANEDYPAFMTHIENCELICASIWLNDSDSRIINNYIWANGPNENHLSCAIRLSNSSVNISGNDIVAGVFAGIQLYHNSVSQENRNDAEDAVGTYCSCVRIENNYFDGSWDSVYTGCGIVADMSTHCIINGNVFANGCHGGVQLIKTTQVTITNNVFFQMNRGQSSASCFDINISSDAGWLSRGNIVAMNQHYRTNRLGVPNAAVFVDSFSQAGVFNNSVIGLNEGAYAYVNNPFVMNTSRLSMRKDNCVSGEGQLGIVQAFMYEDGEALVVGGSGIVNVFFSPEFAAMGITPKMQDLNVVFSGQTATQNVSYNVRNLTSSGFQIAYQGSGSASSTLGTFYWRVDLR